MGRGLSAHISFIIVLFGYAFLPYSYDYNFDVLDSILLAYGQEIYFFTLVCGFSVPGSEECNIYFKFSLSFFMNCLGLDSWFRINGTTFFSQVHVVMLQALL